ncbi:probable maleylacetoacetate isomerase 1 isoform X1 [Drosophila takahashii]|uniref:probable maleylacetoacetate isomerase 1 isoform X1 n=2 Tax=Drosophila takahashii TaxID=29030 RepID=UPI001CF8C0D2|nr:probable maleylacetoacetate isomerase 1 isoform X1 [Drosophila takahashii]
MAAVSHLASKGVYLAQLYRPFGSNGLIRTMATNPQPLLYSYWPSSCSWRVRIALAIKKIDYEIKPTSLVKTASEHAYTDEYKEVNPMQKVPSLKIDGHTLCDSVAIMHYLDETRPEPALLPQDPIKRAKVREIVESICSGVQPLQNSAVLGHIGKEKSLEWAQHWISRGFQGLEKILSQSAGKFCVGDELTMADICLVPQVRNARRYKADLSSYPTIVRLDEYLQKLDVFQTTHPSKQPDCPPEFAKK